MKKNHFAPLAHKHIIYQLLVRVFSNAVSKNKAYGTLRENGCGKFIDIDESVLSAIQELGVTHIWYTGILEHSSLSAYPEAGIPADDPFIVKGRAGSPYAVRDYYDVDPDLAVQVNQRLEEFEAMLNRTHAAGLKAIIDFVPNHVARSYASDKNPGRQPDFGAEDDPSVMFRPDNNFLYLAGEGFTPPADYQPLGGAKLRAGRSRFQEHPARVTGNDVYSSQPSSNDWFETIKLNFGVDPHPPHHCYFDPLPRTWLQLLDILIYWCEKGVDGFRCDMAEMVPAEFWEWIIPCVKTRFPDCIFIGEIYKPGLYRHYLEKGYFDYLYDKVSLYDTLCGIIRGQTPADELSRCIKSVEDFSEKMLSFLENHDELRLASSQFTGEIMTAWPAMVVCATCSKGPVMLYFGQEVGETADVNVGFAGERGRTSIFDYCAATEHQKWYNRGRCDGGKLSEPQRYLRRAYASLLRLAACSEAINKGGFYDLQYINRHHQSEGFDERYHYAFIRHSQKEKLVVVVNFNRSEKYRIHLRIPPDALKHSGIPSNRKLKVSELLTGSLETEIYPADLFREGDRFSGLVLDVPPKQAYILRFD